MHNDKALLQNRHQKAPTMCMLFSNHSNYKIQHLAALNQYEDVQIISTANEVMRHICLNKYH